MCFKENNNGGSKLTYTVTDATSRICRIIMPGCTNVKIAITAMPIATKFGRVATYYERLIPIKLDYPLIK